MLYRHFKGGIYFLHGTAEATNSKLLLGRGELFAQATLIRYETDELESVDVLLFTDRYSGVTQLIFADKYCGRQYVLYQNIDGRFWLRRKIDFYSKNKFGQPRFEPMTQEMIFTYMTEYHFNILDGMNSAFLDKSK